MKVGLYVVVGVPEDRLSFHPVWIVQDQGRGYVPELKEASEWLHKQSYKAYLEPRRMEVAINVPTDIKDIV